MVPTSAKDCRKRAAECIRLMRTTRARRALNRRYASKPILAQDGNRDGACRRSCVKGGFSMDNTTLLIIIIIVLLVLGGGWYGRGRWF
jgi:hypothetical protein